eukprot:74764-Pleurochrysis_carterae.AAC.1
MVFERPQPYHILRTVRYTPHEFFDNFDEPSFEAVMRLYDPRSKEGEFIIRACMKYYGTDPRQLLYDIAE